MGASVFYRAFSAGELDPGLSVRSDLALYGQGLRRCRNFLVKRSGGVVSRPGLLNLGGTKDNGPAVLFAYIFAAADLSYVVEAGDHYFRFWHRVRGLVSELATPYPYGALRPINPLTWHQAAGVVLLTHLDYPPMELRFAGSDTFTLAPAQLAPSIVPPHDPTATAGEAGTITFRYQITSVMPSYEESLPSVPVDLLNAKAGTVEKPHVIGWVGTAGAIEYKVYRDDGANGTFGYLGTATGMTSFRDIGAAVDYAFTPPLPRLGLMDAPLRYPATAAVHQQRRVYAGTHDFRDIVYASRTGLPWNFTHRSPMQEDDAITWRTVTKELQTIRHMVSLGPLILLTDRGEWLIRGDSDGGLTPATIYPDQLGYVGSGWTPPVVYGDRLLFVQARDTVVRELVFDREVDGLTGRDLTRNAAHLFRGREIVSMAFSLEPDAILWCVNDYGYLVGLTYIPDEDVLAWHWHETTAGIFESVVTIPEPLEDAVYVIVNRQGDRWLEKFDQRDESQPPIAEDPAALRPARLDGRVRYRGPATRTVGNLRHLAGQTVVVAADGGRQRAVVSRDGVVTLAQPVTQADFGLTVTADLETLELDLPRSDVRDKRKKMTALAILVENSLANFSAGPDYDHLKPVRVAQWEDGRRRTGRIELQPTGTFNDDGRVVLRHTEPSTLTVLGLVPVIDVGG